MRFIHTSDWHLGRRLHSADLHDAHRTFLEWLLEQAVDLDVDAVVVSGDIYDRAIPPADSVTLLDRTVARFAEAEVPLIISAGNHDNPVRLQYAGAVMERSGIHLRTDLAGAHRPVILTDEHGSVGFYAIPYLIPEAVMDDLGAARSHESVLSAVGKRINDDAAERGLTRTVVAAHAFVTGSAVSDSEREISVGGVADVNSSIFRGFSYVALGHLHGAQAVGLADSQTVIEYSGSPLTFSFSERHHTKSVTLVDLDAAGAVTTRRLPTPVPRPVHQIEGHLDDIIARASEGDLAHLADAWVKVVLLDVDRPQSPMERLRAVLPHTLVLEFRPPDGARDGGVAPVDPSAVGDPTDLLVDFFTHVTGEAPDDEHRALMRTAVDADLAAQREA